MVDKKFGIVTAIAAVLLAVIVASGCLMSKPTEPGATPTASPTASPTMTVEPTLVAPVEGSAAGGEEVPNIEAGAPSGENLDLGSLI